MELLLATIPPLDINLGSEMEKPRISPLAAVWITRSSCYPISSFDQKDDRRRSSGLHKEGQRRRVGEGCHLHRPVACGEVRCRLPVPSPTSCTRPEGEGPICHLLPRSPTSLHPFSMRARTNISTLALFLHGLVWLR